MHVSPLSFAATALSVSVQQLRILEIHRPQRLPRPLATGARTERCLVGGYLEYILLPGLEAPISSPN